MAMAIFAYAIRDNAVSGDSKGDSVYYLGLLYTFAALVAALLTFDWGTADGAEAGTAAAIRNFGIALLTTIVGLAGRVWFTMSEESPGDVVETAKSELEDAVYEMRRSLDRARDDLDTLAAKFRESAGEMAKIIRAITGGTRKAANTAASLAEYAGRVDVLTRTYAKSIEGHTDLMRGFVHSMSAYADSISDHANSIGAFVRSIGGGSSEVERFRNSLVGAQEGVDRLAELLAEVGQLSHAVSAMNGATGAAAHAMSELRRGTQTAVTSASTMNREFAGLQDGTGELAKALGRLAEGVNAPRLQLALTDVTQRAQAMGRDLGAVGTTVTSLDVELSTVGKAAAEARRDLASLSDTTRLVDQEFAGAGNQLVAQVGGIKDCTVALNGDLAALRERAGESIQTLEGFNSQVRDLARSVAEASHPVASPLRADTDGNRSRFARLLGQATLFLKKPFRRSP